MTLQPYLDVCDANVTSQSYHDLAVRLEPIILELEREQNDLLLIAHESVLRVLYGYLMACSATDIPFLSFPRDEIIEIIPASYNNQAKRIHIPGLPDKLVPGSPEDIRIPVPPSVLPSGAVSPMSGLGTPAREGSSGQRTPVEEGRRPPGVVVSVEEALAGGKKRAGVDAGPSSADPKA